jgi:hypothetical protein
MGPSMDAVTKKPIAKHAVLDSEGIVYAGTKIMPKQVTPLSSININYLQFLISRF